MKLKYTIRTNQEGPAVKREKRSLVWVSDEHGKEYVCSLDNSDKKTYEELTEEEKRRCADVSRIVGRNAGKGGASP